MQAWTPSGRRRSSVATCVHRCPCVFCVTLTCSSRASQWKLEFHECGPLLRCMPSLVMCDPDNEFGARVALRLHRHHSSYSALLSPDASTPQSTASVSSTTTPMSLPDLISQAADPHDPTLLVEWSVRWPNLRTGGRGMDHEVKSGHWKLFYKRWAEMLRTYRVAVHRASAPPTPGVARRPVMHPLHCELSPAAHGTAVQRVDDMLTLIDASARCMLGVYSVQRFDWHGRSTRPRCHQQHRPRL